MDHLISVDHLFSTLYRDLGSPEIFGWWPPWWQATTTPPVADKVKEKAEEPDFYSPEPLHGPFPANQAPPSGQFSANPTPPELSNQGPTGGLEPTPRYLKACWNCGIVGHLRVDCPTGQFSANEGASDGQFSASPGPPDSAYLAAYLAAYRTASESTNQARPTAIPLKCASGNE